ncbi:hypothetical protein VNI00_011932 [Paramarasmius palmivorus]|uniref:Cytochrome P450 n=1 Tax=Paramarasmius palmivorus TaxID=297713 RepID=A0AAW0CBZ8_9AGAR
MDNQLPLILVGATALWLVWKIVFTNNERNKLPPGPFKYPLIGNALEMFKGKSFEQLMASYWEEHGPLVHLSILGRDILFINDLQIAQELTEKRGSIYSDRPPFIMFKREFLILQTPNRAKCPFNGSSWMVLGLSDVIVCAVSFISFCTSIEFLFNSGPQFRKHRRMMNAVLSEKAVDSFRDMQAKSALLFVRLLVSDSAKDLQMHIKRFAASTMMKVAYDHDVESLEDPIVKTSLEVLTATLELGTVSATLVDNIPALARLPTWAPFAGFKRRALALRSKVEMSQEKPYEMVKQRMMSGENPDCFVSKNVEECGGPDVVSSDDEREIQGAAAALYTGAEETTLAVIHSFFLAMLHNPDVYRGVQEEIDRVIGFDRLPVPEDRAKLPYLEATIRELYRWTSPAAINAPHRVREDDIYNGYLIPKDTDFLILIDSGLLRQCPEPEAFIPQRFIDGTKLGKVPADPKDVIFGFGRRRCPGWHFADRSVWVAVSYVATLFDILPEAGPSGQKALPPIEFAMSNTRHPKPFNCSVIPRANRAKLLKDLVD